MKYLKDLKVGDRIFVHAGKIKEAWSSCPTYDSIHPIISGVYEIIEVIYLGINIQVQYRSIIGKSIDGGYNVIYFSTNTSIHNVTRMVYSSDVNRFNNNRYHFNCRQSVFITTLEEEWIKRIENEDSR